MKLSLGAFRELSADPFPERRFLHRDQVCSEGAIFCEYVNEFALKACHVLQCLRVGLQRPSKVAEVLSVRHQWADDRGGALRVAFWAGVGFEHFSAFVAMASCSFSSAIHVFAARSLAFSAEVSPGASARSIWSSRRQA